MREPETSPAVLSPARIRLALLSLAIGGFAIGATEFTVMGLLPQVASDLLPTQYAADPEQANSQAGALISAYAVGVVVGAPTIAAFGARLPRKRLLLILLAAFSIGSLVTVWLPTFEGVLIARFLTALPHGAYFGIAALVAAKLMGPGNRAKGVAFVLSGLTVCNIIGVPLITWLGQEHGWRVAYFAVALLFVITAVAVWLTVPWQPGSPGSTLRSELGAFKRAQVWLAVLIGSLGFGGLFAVYAFISPLATDVTGLTPEAVPWILSFVGVAMTAGNLIGGRYADRNLTRSLVAVFFLAIPSLLCLALTAQWLPAMLVFLFLTAGSFSAMSPIIQTRLMDVAGDSQTLAAALNHSSLNVGNATGAYLAGLAIAAGFGYTSAVWVGMLLAISGILIVAISLALERKRTR